MRNVKDMAQNTSLLSKLGLGIVFGILGYILGTILGSVGIFPELAWGPIGLLLGVFYGAFKDEIGM
jgi:hypothetical protein